jgi:glycosyltransferase involved in cell wall biosynthesis
MKILLLGEFSGLFSNLKDGLVELGHEVVLASTGDGWRKMPSDINWLPTRFKGRLGYLEHLYNEYNLTRKLKGFDVVQFISDYLLFDTIFGLDKICYKNLMRNNLKNYFVMAGDNPTVWQYWSENKDQKLLNLITQSNNIDFTPKSVRKIMSEKEKIKTLKLVQKANGLIPIMYEYAEPYRKMNNICQTIPIPINCNKIEYLENTISSKVVVFHGLNRRGAKGTEYVEKAFEILRNKYPNDLELIIAGNMQYADYLKFIKNVNVIIDQTNSYSLGMNGLISLALGKITMGGAEILGQQELGYEDCPIINIKPEPNDIVAKIEDLLERKSQFSSLGRQSRNFVERYHNHIDVAKKYLDVWNSNKL